MSTALASVAPPSASAFPRRWTAAIVMICAVLMDMIDITIVNVTLPTIRADLGATPSQLEWVISAYMLAFAATLIIAGSLGDLLGRKRVFLTGIVVFGLASLGAGLAGDAGPLIAARLVQGAAAALMIPQLLATFRVIFDGEERGKAIGLYGAILGFASAFGLLLGGVLTSADLFGLGWRSIFFVNVPVAVATLALGARFVPETFERSAKRPDFLGALILAGSIVAIAYPLLEGRANGWPVWGWGVIGAGLLGLVALAIVEGRRRHDRVAPLLRTSLFRIPAFSAGLIVQLAFAAGLQGFFLVFAIWLQAGQGFGPLGAGLTTVAFSVGSFILAPNAVALAQRYGRLVLFAGGVMMAIGTLAVIAGAGGVGTGSDPWPIVPGLVVAGAGLSLLIIPLANVVLAAVPAEAAGGASGVFSTAQQLGGALGVAVVGSIFFSAAGRDGFTDALTTALPACAGLFALAAVLSLVLPKKAIALEDEGF